MAKVKIGKPPQGLKDEELHNWYLDAFEDAYEKTLFEHREARRKAEAQVEEKQAELDELAKKTPAEGDVVLKGDEAKRYQEKLKDLDLDAMEKQVAEAERVTRRAFLREAAQEAGFKPETFTELVELKGVEVTTEEADGKTAYKVKTQDGEGKEQLADLAEHFQKQYADWLPALTPQGDQGTGQPPRQRPAQTPSTGRLPSSGTRQRGEDPQRQILERARERAARSKNVALQGLSGDDGGNS